MSDVPILTDTEWQIILQAIDAYSLPWGPEEELRLRARKKVAAALQIAQRPFKEPAK